jgi:hypothetical protein
VFVVFQMGTWMMAGDDVPLLRLRPMKLAASGSGDDGEDPCPTCHKVSVSSLATARFIGSNSFVGCKVLSQISVWWLFVSFSSAAIVAAEDGGERCFGEAQVSSRVEL